MTSDVTSPGGLAADSDQLPSATTTSEHQIIDDEFGYSPSESILPPSLSVKALVTRQLRPHDKRPQGVCVDRLGDCLVSLALFQIFPHCSPNGHFE